MAYCGRAITLRATISDRDHRRASGFVDGETSACDEGERQWQEVVPLSV
jgi:hypothetical protein